MPDQYFILFANLFTQEIEANPINNTLLFKKFVSEFESEILFKLPDEFEVNEIIKARVKMQTLFTSYLTKAIHKDLANFRMCLTKFFATSNTKEIKEDSELFL